MRILIVDDTRLNIALLQHLVNEIPDTESIAFADPREAVEWCEFNEPDMVVVDYVMPNMNGIEFVQAFRGIKGYAEIPVLMVTSNSETSVRHEALESGVTDFLNKPLDSTEFLARIKNMLALRLSQKRHMDHAAWLADEVSIATAKIRAQELETIMCLSKAAEYRDYETGAHILRMAHYSKHIARELGLPLDQQNLLLEAAPMHDVGKVGIADAILLKPGKLTEQEFTVMKRHAEIGYDLLKFSSSPLLKIGAEIAYTHHEKFDGSGYPRGLAGSDIPLFGRIVAVADVFDALTSDRPYKKGWSIEQASQFIREGAGKHFDPTCVDAFFNHFNDVLAIKNKFTEETAKETAEEVSA